MHHESLWLHSRDLLEKGGISLDIYDNLTPKRIHRIIELQEKRVEERNRAMEKENANMANNMKFPK